jgi:hypothetical protein
MADKKGFVGIPTRRPRGKSIKSKGELLGEYGDLLNAVEGSSGDPRFIKSGTKVAKPAIGYKKDRIYCVTDADKEGVYLDLGDGVSAPLKVGGNDIRSTSGAPVVTEAETLCVRTGATNPGIYHDDGATIVRVANLNTKIIPAQLSSINTNFGNYDSDSWSQRHSLTLAPGSWLINCGFEIKAYENGAYNFVVTDDSVIYAGGSSATDFRMDAPTDDYTHHTCVTIIPYGISTRTIKMYFGGGAARGTHVRFSYMHALEILAGG